VSLLTIDVVFVITRNSDNCDALQLEAYDNLYGCVKQSVVCVEVFFFGTLAIALSFVTSYFTSKIIQTAATVFGVLGCPIVGIFIMGFFMPFCNSAVSQPQTNVGSEIKYELAVITI